MPKTTAPEKTQSLEVEFDGDLSKYAAINQAAKNFTEIVLLNCPRSADRSAAIVLIRNARRTANATIALSGLSL
jgi:hypothetical protein